MLEMCEYVITEDGGGRGTLAFRRATVTTAMQAPGTRSRGPREGGPRAGWGWTAVMAGSVSRGGPQGSPWGCAGDGNVTPVHGTRGTGTKQRSDVPMDLATLQPHGATVWYKSSDLKGRRGHQEVGHVSLCIGESPG